MVGMGVGVAVGVGVGVLVGVAVLIGVVVAVGNGVALGAGVDVGADAGAQADKIKLTSKNTTNVRFIFRVLLWRSSRPTACASPAPRSAAERRQVQARVGQAINHSMTIPPVQPNASANQMTKVCKHSGIRGQMLDFYFAVGFQPFLDLLKRLPINFVAFFQHLCSMPDSVIVILK